MSFCVLILWFECRCLEAEGNSTLGLVGDSWFNSLFYVFQCDPALLPEPNHVMLNHLYALSIKVHYTPATKHALL